MLELFQKFVNKFPQAQTYREKMFRIDKLLHGFHWSVKYGPTRPVAVNLIEGRLWDVILFLDELSYGPGSTPGTTHTASRLVREKPKRQKLGIEKTIRRSGSMLNFQAVRDKEITFDELIADLTKVDLDQLTNEMIRHNS